MGEKFDSNPQTGTGSMSIPIAISPGRAGFTPSLSLSYNSAAGNGSFGFGWRLDLPAITRKTDKGLPLYRDDDESDVFILAGTEDLVPVLLPDGSLYADAVSAPGYIIHRYRPRTEGLFARIERWTRHSDGDVHWRSISRENLTTCYGKSPESRIQDPANPSHVYSWLVCEVFDDRGNAAKYDYKAENSERIEITALHEHNRSDTTRSANRYLKRIRYGNAVSHRLQPDLSRHDWFFEVVFDYGDHDSTHPTPAETQQWSRRLDPFSNYRAGFEIRTYRLCHRVLMFHHFDDRPEAPGYDGMVRSTDFVYRHELNATDSHSEIYSFLAAVSQPAWARGDDGKYTTRQTPPLKFTYSEARIDDEIREIDRESLENLPHGLSDSSNQWIDLDGEGISGIFSERGDAWFYKRNLGPLNVPDEGSGAQPRAGFGPLERVDSKPGGSLGQRNGRFMDLAGDGQLDLVMLDQPAGYYQRGQSWQWERFHSFKSWPGIDLRNPNTRLIDLTGDGHADILITEDEALVWHPSLAEDGFAAAERVHKAIDEEQGPRLVFADGSQSIYLADFSGDGLTDLARIRNGEVSYWPNLGYGRFGARVTMDDSPWFTAPDQFEQQRIRLTDIDGSGTADIIYLGRDSVQLYYNRSGNSFASRQTLERFPVTDNLASVVTVDLLGNGTSCLVWSSPLPDRNRDQLRYIDLMAGGKPHLLIRIDNNLGGVTDIRYAPSTRYYLADKMAGKPWVTRLPYPVQCVELVTVRDRWRGTRFSTRYSYHHGYFDGSEREFRGFGRVEQIDTEDYGSHAAGNAASPYITNDNTLFQPPVKTVSWFHTGAYFGRENVLSQFRHEYFDGFTEISLPEPDLGDDDWGAAELREGLRACKGMLLRREIYELDLDALAAGRQLPVKLFSTAYHGCRIERLQPQNGNRHAVFLATESETISYHYELDLRDPGGLPDPRISHTLNLKTDEFGNVLQAAAITYPRRLRFSDATLPGSTIDRIRTTQMQMHLVYTESRFTNTHDRADAHRLPAPAEIKTFELTGFSPGAGDYFTLAELRRYRLSNTYQGSGITVEEIDYQRQPDRVTPQKRRIDQQRILYFADDPAQPGFLRAPLPWGRQGALGLPFETYRLALTESHLAEIFGARLTAEVRTALGDASQSGYLADADLAARFTEADTAGEFWIRSGIAGFSADAADHFFLPERFIDAFDASTSIEYDGRDLFVQSSTDPVGNRVTVLAFDYRVLAPRELRDINGNLSQVEFDTLGQPTAIALRGKGTEGDDLAVLTPEIIDPPAAVRAAFFTSPYDETEARRLLGGATSRHLYYLGETINPDGSVEWGNHPPCAAAISRERHVASLPADATSPLQLAFEYSDAGGNLLLTRNRAEPETAGGPLRWIANGKTILNNKGKPVKQYEPYFTSSQVFEEARESGVTPVIYYDAVGRIVRTENADGSFSRVEFSPWHATRFDANDTVLEAGNDWYARHSAATAASSDQRAARMAAEHAATPARVFLDSQGREAIAVAHNRLKDDSGSWIEQYYTTFTRFDTEGKPLWIRDTRGNIVMQYIWPPKPTAWSDEPGENISAGTVTTYDLAGNLLFQHGMDGGQRWMIPDAAGESLFAWDTNDRVDDSGATHIEERFFHATYDALHRPREYRLRVDGGDWNVIERFVYGDSPGVTDASLRNLRGQLYHHYDPGGRLTQAAFDFRGNPLESRRRLCSAYAADLIDWPEDFSNAGLELETFTLQTEYDALDRMTRQWNWHLTATHVAVYEPQYNERGLLKSENLTIGAQRQGDGSYRGGTTREAVREIRYDARGQREHMILGNGTRTRYAYDAETFRLTQLRTTRPASHDPAFPDHRAALADDRVVQQLHYSYDPVGNIVEILDEAYQPVFFRNQRVEPRCRYEYDALYRLTEASGRENASVAAAPGQHQFPAAASFPLDPGALRNYSQRYRYDGSGNIEQIRHSAATGSWTRDYEYAADSNRLLRTWTGGDRASSVEYAYDIHGSMLNLNRVPDSYRLRWDYRDLVHRVNLGGGGQAWYNYAADKQRLRKRIERSGGIVEERLYLDGMELYRRFSAGGDTLEEIETHHLFVNEQRILQVDDVLDSDNAALGTGILYRYQYGNHLGSAVAELDADARIVSYEEYHPYGTTAFGAFDASVRATAKRYRYTGVERDEESGLGYHSARYYAPWLGRWCSTDPLGFPKVRHLYAYDQNPLVHIDRKGTQPRSILREWQAREARGLPTPRSDIEIVPNTPEERLRAIRSHGIARRVYEHASNPDAAPVTGQRSFARRTQGFNQLLRDFQLRISTHNLGSDRDFAAAGQSEDWVDYPEEDAHHLGVARIIQTAIDSASEYYRQRQGAVPTHYRVLLLAHRLLILTRRIDRYTSQSILLRDAAHYFSGRRAQFRIDSLTGEEASPSAFERGEETESDNSNPPGSWDLDMQDRATWFYNILKWAGFGEDLQSSEQPASPPGVNWALRGTRDARRFDDSERGYTPEFEYDVAQ